MTARERAEQVWSPGAHAVRVALSDWWVEFARLNSMPLDRADILLLPVRKVEHVTLDTAPCDTIPFLLD
jgi:hypothetical protein